MFQQHWNNLPIWLNNRQEVIFRAKISFYFPRLDLSGVDKLLGLGDQNLSEMEAEKEKEKQYSFEAIAQGLLNCISELFGMNMMENDEMDSLMPFLKERKIWIEYHFHHVVETEKTMNSQAQCFHAVQMYSEVNLALRKWFEAA